MKGLKKIAFVLASVLLCGCSLIDDLRTSKIDKVLILYSVGFNSLGPDLINDIKELSQGNLPSKSDDNAVVVVSHATSSYMAYSKPVNPCVIRLYKDRNGKAQLDTLLNIDNTKLLTDSVVMENALNFIAATFDAKSYGMIYSSHATGWLPSGYYAHPSTYDHPEGKSEGGRQAAARRMTSGSPYSEFSLPGPKVKSVGQEIQYDDQAKVNYSYEMEINDLASSIPFKLDYILFDACLMGCVEVAYELRNVCDRIGFSPAEVLTDGMDYAQMLSRLLKPGTPDLNAVAQDYFDLHAAQSGDYQSATYTIVNCREIEALAAECKSLFEKYREDIALVDAKSVQHYHRYEQHWFYDLEDILIQSGMSQEDKASLDKVLDKVVECKVHTDYFMPNSGGFKIKFYSGMSTYLPNMGSEYLNSFYKTLSWNKDTGFVQ